MFNNNASTLFKLTSKRGVNEQFFAGGEFLFRGESFK